MRVANILEELEDNHKKPTTMSQAKLTTTRLPKLDMQSNYSMGSKTGGANVENFKRHEANVLRELNRQTPPQHEDMTPILNQQWEETTVNPEQNMSNYFRTIPQKSNPVEVRSQSYKQSSGILP
jgi:hypothetical protein